jgi:predicted acylesterase/phospholipase RssA
MEPLRAGRTRVTHPQSIQKPPDVETARAVHEKSKSTPFFARTSSLDAGEPRRQKCRVGTRGSDARPTYKEDAMGRFRMLSIDGGGIRGIVPAMLLDKLESVTGKTVPELFDVVAGTSTGGILALALTLRDERDPSRPKFRAADVVKLYEEHGGKIFAKPKFWAKLDSVVGRLPGLRDIGHALGIPRDEDLRDLFAPKYGEEGRRDVLQAQFGGALLKDAMTRLFITSYETELRIPVFFVSRPSDEADEEYFESISGEVSILDAALATSAAPTYFPPHQVPMPKRPYSLVDGGIFANNPTGLARSFLRDGAADSDLVVSLGTGSMQVAYPYDEIKNWGAIHWASPMLKMMFDGQTEAVALAVRRTVGDRGYFRMQGLLGKAQASDDMDDVTPENLERLKELARSLMDTPDFRKLCDAVASG